VGVREKRRRKLQRLKVPSTLMRNKNGGSNEEN
jgi:hypothetical protein